MKSSVAIFVASLVLLVSILAFTGSLTPKPLASASLFIGTKTGHGSGIHIGNGYVITAEHVVDGSKQSEIKAIADDGRELSVRILWASKEFDLALLSINGSGLESRAIECIDPLPGDLITALGSPLDLRFQQMAGRVSGPVTVIPTLGTVQPLDIALGPGMSGGGILNASGKIVGISRAIAGGGIAIGLDVPASTVCLLLGMAR